MTVFVDGDRDRVAACVYDALKEQSDSEVERGAEPGSAALRVGEFNPLTGHLVNYVEISQYDLHSVQLDIRGLATVWGDQYWETIIHKQLEACGPLRDKP